MKRDDLGLDSSASTETATKRAYRPPTLDKKATLTSVTAAPTLVSGTNNLPS
jgi:hypothetical protein